MLNEDFISYLWQYQLLKSNLQTSHGESLTVLSPGQLNKDSGPDFSNAKIKIGDTIWAGNIELHVNSSDWTKHNHNLDPAYDNVILHVVLENDREIMRKNSELIPTLELKGNFDENIVFKYQSFINSGNWIPCQNLAHKVGHFEKMMWFDSLMTERLEQKTEQIVSELLLTQNDLQEVFYQKLAENFGFKTNAYAFKELAHSLPLKVLARHASDEFQIEALMFGQAGLLNSKYSDVYPLALLNEYNFLADKYKLKSINRKLWKFMRLHPANFPTIRISQLANIIFKLSANFNKIFEAGKLSDVVSLLQTETSEYWKDHYQFDKKTVKKAKVLGQSSINLIMINTIIPFLFIYGKMKGKAEIMEKAMNWLENIKPENNHITRNYTSIGLKPENAVHSQALLQMKHNYCEKKRCLQCRIGHFILNKDN